MTNFGNYPHARETAARALIELQQTSCINGEPYSNYLVNVENSRFVNDYDPDMLASPVSVMLCWPGASSEPTATMETIVHEDALRSEEDMRTEVLLARSALLNGSIDRTTIDRVPERTVRIWDRCKQLYRAPILHAEQRCGAMRLPLGVLQISQVDLINLQVPAPETRVAHLWTPVYLSPKPVLNVLKRGTQKIIANEAPEQQT